MSAPVLAYFDQSKPCTIQLDASKKSLGEVLLQDNNRVNNVTPTLNESCMLSVVFALERSNHYVYGYRTTVNIDHKPLVSVWKKCILCNSPSLQRLLPRLF